MQKTKLILGIVIMLTITFLGLQIFKQSTAASFVRPAIIPLLTLAYLLKFKDISSFFFLFLFSFSLSEIVGTLGYFAYENEIIDNFQYYTGNILYILAYIFLILEIYKHLNFKKLLRQFPIHLLILFVLDIYCIVLVSKISITSGYMIYNIEFIIEVIYNSAIMLLLTIAVINYLTNDSNKSMSLLFGALCVLFAEVLQVAFYYVEYVPILEIISNMLLIIAFVLFYIQSGMSYFAENRFKTIDKLEV